MAVASRRVWFTRFQLKKDRLGWVAGLKPVELQFMRLLLRHCKKKRDVKEIEMEFLHRLEIPEKPERIIFTFTQILVDEDDDSLELNVQCSHFTSFRWHRKAIRKESDDVVKNGFLWKFSLHFRFMVHVKGLKESFFYSYPLFEFLWLKNKISFSIDIFFLSLSPVLIYRISFCCATIFLSIFDYKQQKKHKPRRVKFVKLFTFFSLHKKTYTRFEFLFPIVPVCERQKKGKLKMKN